MAKTSYAGHDGTDGGIAARIGSRSTNWGKTKKTKCDTKADTHGAIFTALFVKSTVRLFHELNHHMAPS